MLCDPADFSIRHALIWFQDRPLACRAAYKEKPRWARGLKLKARVLIFYTRLGSRNRD
jgi:hypothetical protein